MKKNAFSLLEILVVCAIIGTMIGLLAAAVSRLNHKQHYENPVPSSDTTRTASTPDPVRRVVPEGMRVGALRTYVRGNTEIFVIEVEGREYLLVESQRGTSICPR